MRTVFTGSSAFEFRPDRRSAVFWRDGHRIVQQRQRLLQYLVGGGAVSLVGADIFPRDAAGAVQHKDSRLCNVRPQRSRRHTP